MAKVICFLLGLVAILLGIAMAIVWFPKVFMIIGIILVGFVLIIACCD